MKKATILAGLVLACGLALSAGMASAQGIHCSGSLGEGCWTPVQRAEFERCKRTLRYSFNSDAVCVNHIRQFGYAPTQRIIVVPARPRYRGQRHQPGFALWFNVR